MPRPADLVRFTEIAGVPVSWMTWDNVRSRGGELRKPFLDMLNRAFSAVWMTSPWGAAKCIRSGGAFVDRRLPPPPRRDRHAEGAAFDVCGIRWEQDTLEFDQALEKPELYLAVISTLRIWIPQDLDWWTKDGRHKGHAHLDSRPVGDFDPKSWSDVCCLQAQLHYVHGLDIGASGANRDGVDGRMGQKTLAALNQVLKGVRKIGGKDGIGAYHLFLEATASAAWSRVVTPATAGPAGSPVRSDRRRGPPA